VNRAPFPLSSQQAFWRDLPELKPVPFFREGFARRGHIRR
jgi:hypothetical protein